MTKALLISTLIILATFVTPIASSRDTAATGGFNAHGTAGVQNVTCQAESRSVESARLGVISRLLPQLKAGAVSSADVNQAFAKFAADLASRCKSFDSDPCQDEEETSPAVILRLCEFGCSWLATGPFMVNVAATISPIDTIKSYVSPSVYGQVACSDTAAPPLGIACFAAGAKDQSLSTSCQAQYDEGIAEWPIGAAVFVACCATGDMSWAQTDYGHP